MTLNAIPADSRRPSSSLLGFDCLARPALSAMAHPATLASIALLLVNDHILKRQYPSALTGKLSDFAGLFFFPLLLATLFGLAGAVLGRILPVRRAGIAPSPRKPESAARLCFAVTAVAFAAVKLVPPANSAVTIGLETLLGLPVRIVRDPTDLMALAALWPAWRLWSAATRQPAGPPTRRSLLALGLASLAAPATSPCPPTCSAWRRRLSPFPRSYASPASIESAIASPGTSSWMRQATAARPGRRPGPPRRRVVSTCNALPPGMGNCSPAARPSTFAPTTSSSSARDRITRS